MQGTQPPPLHPYLLTYFYLPLPLSLRNSLPLIPRPLFFPFPRRLLDSLRTIPCGPPRPTPHRRQRYSHLPGAESAGTNKAPRIAVNITQRVAAKGREDSREESERREGEQGRGGDSHTCKGAMHFRVRGRRPVTVSSPPPRVCASTQERSALRTQGMACVHRPTRCLRCARFLSGLPCILSCIVKSY
jgi:hypothetical protein